MRFKCEPRVRDMEVMEVVEKDAVDGEGETWR